IIRVKIDWADNHRLLIMFNHLSNRSAFIRDCVVELKEKEYSFPSLAKGVNFKEKTLQRACASCTL
ncbi:MAG: hypothetical protein MJE63_11555, partial [Proteobacteria bacterium]|nr:hypothetical protein [Pseudomonadota bacterium]